MKKLIAFTAALVVASAAAAGAEAHIVGGGTPNSNNTFPFWGYHPQFRWQTMWFQYEIDEAGPLTRLEWQMWSNPSGGAGGTFTNCRILLCHTTKTALEATFNNNYTGFTPTQVRTGGNLAFTGSGYFDIGITPNTFNYNNSNNLLMEIRWNGDSGGGVPCWRSAQANSRVYASDDNASSGTLQNTGQCIRLHIGTMTGAEPTSLGRIKSLYR